MEEQKQTYGTTSKRVTGNIDHLVCERWMKNGLKASEQLMVDKASSIKRNWECTIHHLVCKFCMQNGLKMTQWKRDALEIIMVSKVTAELEHYLRLRALEGGLRNHPSPPWAGESWDLRRGSKPRWRNVGSKKEKESQSPIYISLKHKLYYDRKWHG